MLNYILPITQFCAAWHAHNKLKGIFGGSCSKRCDVSCGRKAVEDASMRGSCFTPIMHCSYAKPVKLKVHLTPKIFFAKTNPLVIWSIWAKKFLNLVESSIFCALSKSHPKCNTTAFEGVWGGGCWWRLPRNQTQWCHSQLSVFAWENGKQN